MEFASRVCLMIMGSFSDTKAMLATICDECFKDHYLLLMHKMNKTGRVKPAKELLQESSTKALLPTLFSKDYSCAALLLLQLRGEEHFVQKTRVLLTLSQSL